MVDWGLSRVQTPCNLWHKRCYLQLRHDKWQRPMAYAISMMPNGSIAYHEERQPQKNVAQINWGTPCSFHLIDPRSLNSVSISTESILELLPVTYKSTLERFFSSKRTSTKSNEHITDFFCYNVTLFVCKCNKLYPKTFDLMYFNSFSHISETCHG